MANLEEIAKSLNVTLSKPIEKSRSAYKRRPWLEDLDQDQIKSDVKSSYNLFKDKGSIDPLSKRGLSTGFINPVDQPLIQKGSIKGVYRPLKVSLDKLRGNPLRIVKYIFELSKFDIKKITGKMTQTEIIKKLQISRDSARTGIRFLIKNALVERMEFKPGKTGWSKYKLKESIFDEIDQAYIKGSIDPFIEKGSICSSSILNKTTTTNRPLFDWDEIDVSSLENIGLSKKHLSQLRTKNFPDVVQDSINHFSYGLQFNPKLKKYDDPLAVLISVLSKGNSWIEQNYKSSKEIALEKVLEERKKDQQRVLVLEEELIKTEFEKWYLNLKDEEKISITKGTILPNTFSKSMQEKAVKGQLFMYFKENINTKKNGITLV
jgi:hypothetical protein